ncbi:MAG: MFS transporter [Anaeromyxobacter sp. RBG_16_69_14]|nr:MAG: MFS transporter [Anaeromyxobacter sp. RBG_16_69_14]
MAWPNALRSLRHRNLRLFFAGQTVSLVGTWMQSVAQGWLVYRLTHSTELLGLVGFLAQVPVFLFGVWAGSLADRIPRRRIVLATQVNALVQATVLAVLTLSGAVRAWMLLPLAVMLGLTYAFEIPARQALLGEIAGEDMPNALALNSTVVNGARVIGPALAGWVVAALGEGVCFALNAVSFAGTIYAVAVMRLASPRPHGGIRRAHLLDGLAYAGRTPHVVALLALVATSSFFALPYVTLMPVLAKDVLGGDARLLGLLQASAGAGALAAGVSLMVRTGLRGLGRRVGLGALLLGLGLAGVSLSHTAPLSCAFLVLAGFGYLTQMAGTMTLLQGLAPEELRGRVMGLFSTLFVGTTPFGALAGGFAAGRFGVPRVLLAGALVLLSASVAFHLALPRFRRSVMAEHPTLFPPPLVP